VSRSRQTEYSTLKRVDDLSIAVNDIKDEKEILQNSFELATERGDFLQNRLDNVLGKSEENENVFKNIINNVEDFNSLAKGKEKILTKENENLQIKFQILQKAYNSLKIKQIDAENKQKIINQYSSGNGSISTINTNSLLSSKPIASIITLDSSDYDAVEESINLNNNISITSNKSMTSPSPSKEYKINNETNGLKGNLYIFIIEYLFF
jgi:hypothetical protein